MTKKFAGKHDYRWKVESVCQKSGGADVHYLVTLSRGKQVQIHFYLKNILAARSGKVRKVVLEWSAPYHPLGNTMRHI